MRKAKTKHAPSAPPAPEDVTAAAAKLGRRLTPEQAAGLAAYLGLLDSWSARMNLVGVHGWRNVLGELVADSWHLADYLADFLPGLHVPENPKTLDLGAGAGLPGIPLRLFWAAGDYLLVEPRHKRAVFLQTALARTGLAKAGQTRVFTGRVEELPPGELPASLVLGRAFKPWREYLELVRPLVAENGVAVVFANQPPPEAGQVPGGWRLANCREYAAAGAVRWFWGFASR